MKTSTFVGRARGPRHASAWLRLTVLGAGALLAAGCHSYVPTELSAVPEGQVVRLMVTRAGSEEVARAMATEQLRPQVAGQFVGRDNETVLVRIPVGGNAAAAAGGFRLDIGQVVRIPEGEVLHTDRQQFSPLKTFGLAAATAAVTGFVLYHVFDVFSNTRSGGDDPVLIRIPIG